LPLAGENIGLIQNSRKFRKPDVEGIWANFNSVLRIFLENGTVSRLTTLELRARPKNKSLARCLGFHPRLVPSARPILAPALQKR